MSYRDASSANSEFDLDISTAIADATNDASAGVQLDANDIFDSILDSDDGDGAFIAAQQAASNRKSSGVKGKSVKKGGGFQAMGLNHTLLKAITRKGFAVPTPVQRKTIPLLLEGLDVVGMARTGSGKTAAFVIPMIERLKGHSAKVGARAIILSPSRELALQTLKVVRDLGKGADLKSVLLVGGDSLEDQFGFIASNPDIIIATPGRFLHLLVEMDLSLKSVQYMVFDEADRLFEMGFASQLHEILFALPTVRQTLLFSATLPKALTEFAKAGLTEPQLVRLDADSKMSQELESAFFTLKTSEKDGALLHLLKDVIKLPVCGAKAAKDGQNKTEAMKRRRSMDEKATSQATIVFTATKHHVEYLARLISLSGYEVSYVYGALDQTARKIQVSRFRTGETNILVVTDVAARGIDIPVLANVINYDFPPQPKVFIHRVGRTARAGRRGWSYSFVTSEDSPYLIDLQLFLGRKMMFTKIEQQQATKDFNFATDVVIGSLKQDDVERCVEAANRLLDTNSELLSLRGVAVKAMKQYQKSRPSASKESVKRAKAMMTQRGWWLVNPLFADATDPMETERVNMLARVSNFRPLETIFEVGQRGPNKSEAAETMRRRREKIKIDPLKRKRGIAEQEEEEGEGGEEVRVDSDVEMSDASSADLEAAFSRPSQPSKRVKPAFEDAEHFMSYTPSYSLAEEKGYSVGGGASFTEASRSAVMDLTNDDTGKGFAEAHKSKGLRWDKKAKKYVARANDEDGSRGKKRIIGESGQKIAASFKSGRFAEWKNKHKIERMPRNGDLERKGEGNKYAFPKGNGERPMGGRKGGKMWHSSVKAPKAADRKRDDYEVRKKRFADAKEKGLVKGGARSEIRSNMQVQKEREKKERRREKTARPSKRRRKM